MRILYTVKCDNEFNDEAPSYAISDIDENDLSALEAFIVAAAELFKEAGQTYQGNVSLFTANMIPCYDTEFAEKYLKNDAHIIRLPDDVELPEPGDYKTRFECIHWKIFPMGDDPDFYIRAYEKHSDDELESEVAFTVGQLRKLLNKKLKKKKK